MDHQIKIIKQNYHPIRLFVLLIIQFLIATHYCYSNNNNAFEIVQPESGFFINYVQVNIKSIKIFRTGIEISDPVIDLNSIQSVSLSFDDLSDDSHAYSYTIIHCNKDWESSRLSLFDYLEGFEYNPLTNFENSTGTTVPYTHYSLQIPNENTKLKISGNYIIRIVDSYDFSRIYFDVRFKVVEQIARINAKIIQPISNEKKSTAQQLNLTVNLNSITSLDPESEIFTYIYQNNQQYNCLQNIKPIFTTTAEISYTSPDMLIFDGGNEYRYFDTKSLRYNSQEIDNIIQNVDGFNILLKPDENNRSAKYSDVADINGRFLIKMDGVEKSEFEADYLWVYFTLPYYDNLTNKEVYILGEFTDWQCKPEFKMTYNYQRSAYELRLLLKQGFYNYKYLVKEITSGIIDQAFFEGNHFETENEYSILVYLRQMGSKYDRLVGVKTIDSRRPA